MSIKKPLFSVSAVDENYKICKNSEVVLSTFR